MPVATQVAARTHAPGNPVLDLATGRGELQGLTLRGRYPLSVIDHTAARRLRRANRGNGHYQLNWQTERKEAGSCATSSSTWGQGKGTAAIKLQ